MLILRDGVTLYFARHGETRANVEKRFSGDKDTPLTERGLRQARAVGEILRRQGDVAGLDYVASPLARAQASMRIAREAAGLAPDGFRTDARLKEIGLGLWDQLTEAEARALDPAMFERRTADKWHVAPPGGETYAQVAARAESFIADLTRDTFAVSHGAFTRILRGLFLDLSWAQMSALDEPQGVLFRVRGREVVRFDP